MDQAVVVGASDSVFRYVSPGFGFRSVVVNGQLDFPRGYCNVLGLPFMLFPCFRDSWIDLAEINLAKLFKDGPVAP